MFRVLQRTSSEVTVNIPLSLILLISKWQACIWPQTKQELKCNLAGVSTAAFGCNALRMQLFKKPLHSQCSSCTEKKRLAWGVLTQTALSRTLIMVSFTVTYLKEKCDVTKTKFVKLWHRLAYPERTRCKMSTSQKSACYFVTANWWEMLAPLCLDDSIQILVKIAWITTLTI